MGFINTTSTDKMKKTDFLVVGSGIAGLSFALKAAAFGKVCIITKANEEESNTKYAQGGVAVVIDKSDSYENHISDTLIAGDGLCNRAIVEMVVKQGPARIQEIIDYGIQFDRNPVGEYHLAKEGGHSAHRVLHFKDITGLEIEKVLLKQIHEHPNIEIYSHYFALELVTEHHLGKTVDKNSLKTCFGIYVLNTLNNEIETISAKVTLMASGGAGHAYSTTTNPTIATGDGLSMVYRAKGKVSNMEFIQFHPTALYEPGVYPSFLISEALRGHGGILKNKKGEAFVNAVDPRGSLAPRDIVARAIDAEMKKSGADCVFLDMRHIGKSELMQEFPNIYAKCLSIGIDMSKDLIPVVPAAHYMCGGITVDENSKSSIQNLYACGECASTGLHGANRLASNSLLEALVFAHRAFETTIKEIGSIQNCETIPEWNDRDTSQSNEDILVTHNLREVQRIMSDYVGIVRSDFRLERAARRLKLIYDETESFYKKTKVSVPLCELRNLIQVAYIIIKSATLRKESRGLHFNTDYPFKNDQLIQDTIF